MSLTRKAITSVGWMGAVSYFGMACSFAGNLVLARLLAPELFGEVALASGLLALVYMIAGFGSQEAIVQCREDLNDFIPTAVWVSIAISFVLLVLSGAIALVLRLVYSNTVVTIFLILAIARCIGNIADAYSAILRRRFHFQQVSLVIAASVIISFGIAIVAAYLGWGVWSLVLREFVMVLIMLIGYRYASHFRLSPDFSLESARWIWNFGWKLLVSRINEVIFGRIDNVAIGTFIGANQLGQYGQAYRLSILGQQLTQIPLQFVSFSMFSEAQKSPTKLRYGFEKMNYWLFRVTFLLGLLTLFFGEALTVAIYTEKWRLAGHLFSNLAVFLVLTPLSENIKEFLTAVGYVQDVMYARIAQIIIFLPLLFAAITLRSVIGVVWAVNISTAAATLILYNKASRIAKPNWSYLLVRPVIACLTTSGIYITIQSSISSQSIHDWLKLLLSFSIVTISYLGCLTLIEAKAIRHELSIITKGFRQENVKA